jgi:predicted DNA-binding transcriptional regulator AlpA
MESCKIADNSEHTAWPGSPALLSAERSSMLAGVSVRTWSRLNSAGKIPSAVRVGKAKRWRAQELKDWIESGCPDRARWEAMLRGKSKRSRP